MDQVKIVEDSFQKIWSDMVMFMKWKLWAIVVKGSNYRINFWFMINNQTVDRYKILICLKRLNNYE